MRLPLSPQRAGVWVALAALALDQLSKYLLRSYVVPTSWSLVVVTPFFNISHAWNHGVSFSLFASSEGGRRWLLILMALALCALVGWWLKKASDVKQALAYGLILGGAFGNIFDRVVHGAVFDFLQFHISMHYYPSFNVADSCIFLGVCLLLVESWRGEIKRSKSDA